MIQDASRCADDKLSTATKCFQLRIVAYPTINYGCSYICSLGQHLGFPGYLKRQFAGGNEDESLSKILLRVNFLYNGQDVSACFSAAGAGLHHHIFAR